VEYKNRNFWALVLGASSGFGLASVRELARLGFNIVAVHRDRRSVQPTVDSAFAAVREFGVNLKSLNLDALSVDGQKSVLDLIEQEVGKGRIRTLLHSIALGNLKPAIAPPAEDVCIKSTFLSREDLGQTIYNMGTDLLLWAQQMVCRQLFAPDARVFGLTSIGNSAALPGYAAVSAAKCVLESIARTIAVEFAPYGVRCNVLQPGTTDTPALRLIPGSTTLLDHALNANPYSRLTTPDDVAKVVALLSRDEASWINGSLIHVDGGEHLTIGVT
jgi:enoyl-[acyl-carrier protein] reductase III